MEGSQYSCLVREAMSSLNSFGGDILQEVEK